MDIFGRLLGFLRPYKAGVIWSLVLAAAAMVCTVAIPWLTGRAVDQISAKDRDGLRNLAIAIVLVSLARLGLSVFRRLVAGKVSLAIEYDLRTMLYAHLRVLTGSPHPATHGPAKAGEQRRSVIAIDRAAKELGWKPEIPLEEGLRRTVEFFRARLQTPPS